MVGRGQARTDGARLARVVAVLLLAVPSGAQELSPRVEAGWRAYISETERQIVVGSTPVDPFLTLDRRDFEDASRCRAIIRTGEICVTSLAAYRESSPPIVVADALVHHWYGSVLVPDVSLSETLRFVKDYERYPEMFDDVEAVTIRERGDNTLRASLRIKREKVLTVHFNVEQEAAFTMHGRHRASARIIATRIREIDRAGEPGERERPWGEDQGFLWALNAYWKYEERDDGVILEAEIVSLSRTIPWAVRWLVEPFIDSVPRESLEATLQGLREGLLRASADAQAGVDNTVLVR